MAHYRNEAVIDHTDWPEETEAFSSIHFTGPQLLTLGNQEKSDSSDGERAGYRGILCGPR
jgi:hypothetical protein